VFVEEAARLQRVVRESDRLRDGGILRWNALLPGNVLETVARGQCCKEVRQHLRVGTHAEIPPARPRSFVRCTTSTHVEVSAQVRHSKREFVPLQKKERATDPQTQS
jgi:hypothetical protein